MRLQKLLAPMASAARTYSRPDVLHVFGPDLPVHPGPAGEAQDQDHGVDAAAEHRGEGEDQQDVGHRGEDVVDPLEEVVHLAAEEARQPRPAAVPISVASARRPARRRRRRPREPLIAFDSTSRPRRSPPKRQGVRSSPPRWSSSARRARPTPCICGASGSMSLRSTFGPFGTFDRRRRPRPRAGPGSWAEHSARRPRSATPGPRGRVDDSAISNRKAATITRRHHAGAIGAGSGFQAERARRLSERSSARGMPRWVTAWRRSFQHHPRIHHTCRAGRSPG